MKVSVVITTYNGEKHILEQLESIRRQTLKPYEVIICDDVSKDKTVDFVNEYIAKNKLEDSWRIIKNSENKGYIRNFIDTLLMSTGDIIFLSDQDDIWDENKIERMTTVYQAYEAEAVYCLDDYIDSDGNIIKNIIGISNRIRTCKKVLPITLEKRIKYGRSPGLCLCFSSGIIQDIVEICKNYGLPHDLPVGLIAAVHKKYYLVNEVLVHHRIHSSNASSPDTNISSSVKSKERQIKSRKIKRDELRVLLEKYSDCLNDKEKKNIKSAISLNEQLIKCIENGDTWDFIKAGISANEYFNKLLLLRNLVYMMRSRS